MKPLTVEQHKKALERLIDLVKKTKQFELINKSQKEEKLFFHLMMGFLLNSISISQTLLNLFNSCEKIEDFPITSGYVIIRPLFETDVNARFIKKNLAKKYAQQYIKYEVVIKYNRMMAIDDCRKNSKNKEWREAMEDLWNDYSENDKIEIENNFQTEKSFFSRINKKRSLTSFFCRKNNKPNYYRNWSGISLSKMAKDKDVDCKEPYNILYSELSSFTHIDISVVNKYLRIESGELSWDMKANERDVNNVLRYAVMFLSDFLEFFGDNIRSWDKTEIDNCLKFD